MFLRLLVAAVWLAGCDPTTTLSFRVGSSFQMSTASLDLPMELRDDSGGSPTVRSIPCMGTCPSSPDVTIECRAGVCDPAPKTVSAPAGDVVDLEAVDEEFADIASSIETIHIDDAQYMIEMNTLTVPIGAVEVFWGPEGASDVGSPGVTKLGTVPPIGAGETRTGEVALDAAGNDALSDYLASTSRRIRFFARTQADLVPGGPYPDGSLRVSVVMSVTAVGRIVD